MENSDSDDDSSADDSSSDDEAMTTAIVKRYAEETRYLSKRKNLPKIDVEYFDLPVGRHIIRAKCTNDERSI